MMSSYMLETLPYLRGIHQPMPVEETSVIRLRQGQSGSNPPELAT
jgi:hypothetical protein